MFNKLTTEIRQLIERSMADIEQRWSYSITVRYRIGNKKTYIYYNIEDEITETEINDNEDEH